MRREGRRGADPGGALWRIVALFALNGLLWASIVPPWQAPDEPKHMEFATLIARRGPFAFAPSAADAELQARITASMSEHRFWWYGRAPGYDPEAVAQDFDELWLQGSGSALARTSPVYHMVVALFLPGNLLAGLYAARVFSVLLGALTVLFVGIAARELCPDEPLVRHGAPLFLALSPMYAFVHSGMAPDPLLDALAALALVLLLRVLLRGATPARMVVLAGTVLVAVAVKRVAIVLVPVALLGLVLRRAAHARRPSLAAAYWLTAAGLLAVAVAGWWFRYGVHGLPQAWRANLGQYFFNDPGQVARIVHYLRTPGVGGVALDYLAAVHNGFWGSFGWAVLAYPTWLYVILGTLSLVGLGGAALRLLDRRQAFETRAALVTLGVALAVTAGAAIVFFLGYLDQPYPVPPQGRYLYAAALPIAVLLAAGWSAWLPRAQQARALAGLAVAMTVLDVVSLASVAAWFYGA